MKNVFILILLTMSIIANAQIEVGIRHNDNSKKALSQTQLIQLRNSEIRFIVPESLKADIESAMGNYWSFSDWSVSSDPDLTAKPNRKQSIFILDVREGPNAQSPEISLCLYMSDFNGEKLQAGRILLQPKGNVILAIQSLNSIEEKRAALFNSGEFYNAGEYLAHNLQAMNNLLASEGSIWLDDDMGSQVYLNKLQESGLYIPDYCFLRRNMLSGQDEMQDVDKVLKKCTLPVESDPGNNKRFVCMYAQAGAAVYLSVFDKVSGNMIYQHKSMNQYKLSSRDFKKLESKIG